MTNKHAPRPRRAKTLAVKGQREVDGRRPAPWASEGFNLVKKGSSHCMCRIAQHQSGLGLSPGSGPRCNPRKGLGTYARWQGP